jgi:NAD(P)H-hydrate epimerase
MKKYTKEQKCRILTRQQVRSVDDWAINCLGVPGVVLMENAGRSCAELVISELSQVKGPQVCIICGKGNNGGDGFVIARHLLNNGIDVKVGVCGNPDKISGEARVNLDILRNLGEPVERLDIKGGNIQQLVGDFTEGADFLVDAVFGTGLTGKVKWPYDELISNINALDIPVMAVDIPSGLDCDSGEPLGAAIRAKYTVSFVAVKQGFAATAASLEYTGEVYVASIGVEPNDNAMT